MAARKRSTKSGSGRKAAPRKQQREPVLREHTLEPANLDARFTIGRTSFRFRTIRDGYEIASGRERIAFRYRRNTCTVEIAAPGGNVALEWRTIEGRSLALRVESGDGKFQKRGDVADVAAGLAEAALTYPRIPALRVLLYQKSTNSEFALHLSNLIGAAAPHREAIRLAAVDWCKVFCAICLAQLTIGGGPTPDDLPACVICWACNAKM